MLTLLAGQDFKRVGAQSGKGPEWAGPCPVCGGGKGSDRFHVWPEQGQGGTFWCRQCGKGGDLIEYYRWANHLSYRDACARAGIDAQTYAPQSAPSTRKNGPHPANHANGWQPVRTEPVPQLWAEHAAKFAEWCHAQLLTNPDQLAWLAKRGITPTMIAKYGLGWNSTDTWRPRESWGLETILRTDKKPKKLWLPCGLVIPQWIGDQVARLRIRRPEVAEGELKYYVVPGSGREPLISNREALAYVVLESELDVVVLDGQAGDLVGVVAMGNASAKPTEDLDGLLSAAVHLSISLDSDTPRKNPTTGKTECPGAQGSLWWLKQYRHADRVPVIGGKDPGDAYQAGVDLRAWVLAGLPPRFHLKAAANAEVKAVDYVLPQSLSLSSRPQGEISTPQTPATVNESLTVGAENTPEQAPDPTANHRILTLTDGREIHIVDDKALWDQLSSDGLIVFSANELQRLQAACVGLAAAAHAEAVRSAVDAKEVFAGAYIRRGEVAA